MIKKVNDFTIWYIEDEFDPDYVDCCINEKKGDLEYYVNLANDTRLPVDYSIPPKVEKEGELTSDAIYRIEYRFYQARKSMLQPMWKLHHSTLKRIISAMH